MPEPLPLPSGVDPTSAQTMQEFGDCLKHLFEVRGMSANRVAEVAQVSSDTVSALVNGRRLSRANTFLRVLKSCKLPPNEQHAWITKRVELLRAQSNAGQQKLSYRIQELETELDQAHGKIAELHIRESELQSALAEEQERAEKLASDHEETDAKLAALSDELKYVREELRRTDADLARLLAQKEALEAANAALRLQAELTLLAEGRRDEAEATVDNLRQRIAELERLLRTYKEPTNSKPQSAPKPKPTPKAQDAPFETSIAVRDSDFGLPYDFSVTFAWYCVTCDKGGSRSQIFCPHGNHDVVEHYSKTVQLKELPPEPCYGRTLRLRGQGNHDDPKLAPGDLLIKVTRRAGRWGSR